jgi:DNA-binding MarR family transcriptional regulator
MKSVIHQLNKAYESRIRLGVMSILMVNDSIDFSNLKELLDTSDGNLASHLTSLEKEGYITIMKQFIGKKPNTSYSVTEEGKKSFRDHLSALEKIIKQSP